MSGKRRESAEGTSTTSRWAAQLGINKVGKKEKKKAGEALLAFLEETKACFIPREEALNPR